MTQRIYFSTLATPIGDLLLTSDGSALTGVYFEGRTPDAAWQEDDEALREARDQLAEYFAGTRTEFSLDLAPAGTPFQLEVWEELNAIPFGTTISYGVQARRLNRPNASRAVGAANGRNPIPVIVPCHRVIGAGGSLTGFGGGLECKKWLIEHEAAVLARRGEKHQPAGLCEVG